MLKIIKSRSEFSEIIVKSRSEFSEIIVKSRSEFSEMVYYDDEENEHGRTKIRT